MIEIQPIILRPKQAAKYLSIGIASFWRLAKEDATFPKPFKIGTQATAVARADLDAWVQTKRKGK